MRSIHYIVLHCNATKEDKDFKTSDIDQLHKALVGKVSGYHYVIILKGNDTERGCPER
ncbi:MAG: hypothetical protein ACMUEM_02040 [Flavobacteriales bacterium AspAUS03]